MEEIPNNHLEYIYVVNNGINYLPNGERRISEPSTVEPMNFKDFWDKCLPGAKQVFF